MKTSPSDSMMPFYLFLSSALIGTKCVVCRKSNRSRGQTAIEMAFVFSMLIFFLFSIVNMGILFHTRNIATYAAFMAARSFQVTGDLHRSSQFDPQEMAQDIGAYGSVSGKPPLKPQSLFADLKTVPVYRVAEDIFVCGLPWMRVPPDDVDSKLLQNKEIIENSPFAKCYEGQRKYEADSMAVGSTVRFQHFGEDDEGSNGKKDAILNTVIGGYAEAGRDPLRYGILSLEYPKYAIFNLFGIFSKSKSGFVGVEDVSVPVLLNPGLRSRFQEEKESKEKNFDEPTKDAPLVKEQ